MRELSNQTESMPGPTESLDSKRQRVLDHPEVAPALKSVFQTIVVESDRGAVLVATSIVDEYLRRLFERSASPKLGHKKQRQLLEYPGPVSSLAAKADIALMTRIIDLRLHTAIHRLRKLRNRVAHDTVSFQLADHQKEMREISDLGPGVPVGVNGMAAELVVDMFLHGVAEREGVLPKEERLFNSPREALDHLSEMPDALAALQERALRLELGIGVVLICGMIVFAWERAEKRESS
jgi:hypothetical protein